MHDDINHRHLERSAGKPSIARRREILQRIGKTSVIAGAAASPLAALAGGGTRKWCKHPVDTNKCVQATISGVASVVLSAQASNEVCSKKCSHYASCTNWPSSCSNGSTNIKCNDTNDNNNTKFCVAFNCNSWTAKDSNGVQRCDQWGNPNWNCLLNKSLPTLCNSHASSPEAHWATALGNANKLIAPPTGAPFPYSPGQVVAYFGSADLQLKSSAYTFFKDYCEQYA